MKFQYYIPFFTALLTIAVEAERSITIPFTKTSFKRTHPLEKRDSGSKALSNYQNVGYLVTIDVGTPPQSLDVMIDTSSADIWIPRMGCTSTRCPITRFDSNSSSTFEISDKRFNMSHPTGNATGWYTSDTISIGGLSVTNQEFGLVSNFSVHNASSPYSIYMDGVLGLFFSAPTFGTELDIHYANSFVHNMKRQNLIQNPIFSVYLNSTSQNGEITFGGIDPSKYQGSITYFSKFWKNIHKNDTKVNGKAIEGYGHWMLHGSGFGIQQGYAFDSVPYLYIIDTSSALSYLPSEAVEYIVMSITGSSGFSIDLATGGYLIDCNSVNRSSVFYLNIANYTLKYESDTTLLVPVSELLIPTGKTHNGTDLCLFGIAPANLTKLYNDIFVIGDSILRSFYTVYDMESGHVGFASAVGSGSQVISKATKSFRHSYIFVAVGLIIAFLFSFVA